MPRRALLLLLLIPVFLQARAEPQAPAQGPAPQWERENEAVYVGDMSKATPASALSPDGRPGTWKAVPYSTAAVAGKMLFSAPGRTARVPELRLPVPVRGRHAVYVGINYQFIWYRPQLLKLRFASDPAFTWIVREGKLGLRVAPGERSPMAYTDRDIVEVFWKTADLTGEDLVIARKEYEPLRLWHAGTDFTENVASSAYLKLVPLGERESAELGRARGREETRRILAVNDMGWLRWARSREELREELEPLRDTDVAAMLWGTYRGFYCSYFRTKAGAVPTGGDNEFQKFFSTFGEGMDRFRKLGIDPLEEAVSHAHRIGIKLVSSIRMDGPKPPPYDGSPGPFFDQHPEYRLVAPDGSRTLRLSLAYPEVRRRYLELFREAMAYGVDGIAVIFTRNFPFVGWEPPVVESFRQKTGLDPRALRPPDDEKFFRHQAAYVTEFVREIRALLDEEQKRRGGDRLILAAVIGGNPPAHPYRPAEPKMERATLEFGWDVRRWIADNLTDYVALHPWRALEVTDDEVRGLSSWTRGTRVRFMVDFFPEELDPEQIRARALQYYAAGADGFLLWNTDLRVKRPAEWRVWSMLGHRRELEEWRDLVRRFFRIVPLKTFGGYNVDSSWWHSTG
jgi:hypothetical protein